MSRFDLACATCPHLTHVSDRGGKLRCPAEGCLCGAQTSLRRGRPFGPVVMVPDNAHRQAAPGSILSTLTLAEAHRIQDELHERVWS